MKRLFLILSILSVVFISCTKEKIDESFSKHGIQFQFAGTFYQFDNITFTGEASCGFRNYELTILDDQKNFFKFDFTDTTFLNGAGKFVMQDIPTNSLPGTSTFWYSGQGITFTPHPYVLVITSFKNGMINGYFSGDQIKGEIHDVFIEEK